MADDPYASMNPFYHNYVFGKKDLKRAKIKWHHRLWLWLIPTNVQAADGYAFHWKQWNGEYYLMKCEPLESFLNA